ncbi:MAG: hypothetical protein ATN35_03690 [Epulopiscium sp. Nele67-Bin004]|nr:MAG: hypothetical protein ATN35_03690 [Epulopiscium sp. Nele67-Bin004]
MDREEILNRAKKENEVADEWEFDVLKNSNMVALILLVTSISVMLIESVLQHFKEEEPFANPFIFVFQLAFLTGVQNFTRFYYEKKLISIIVAIICFIITYFAYSQFM